MDQQEVRIGDTAASWQDVVKVARYGATLVLTDAAWQRIDLAQEIVGKIVNSGQIAYGITTGLGSLCNVVLAQDELSKLSRNTLLSHACGVGEPLSDEQCRAIICSAVINYSHGKSGIRRSIVESLIALLNHGIIPQVPKQGSVGYLTHMAHIGVCLLGMGQVRFQGALMPSAEALQKVGLAPIQLGAKDGLSFVNGTPCMTGLTALAIDDATQLSKWADIISALSFEALKGQTAAFREDILALKPYPGLMLVGENLRQCLANSQHLAAHQGIRTQDALSIRSIPQVHGAARDQLDHTAKQLNIELNSATDNPLILGDHDHFEVVSQANPHGESVAMAADLLAIAMSELGGISERRLDRLLNPLVSGLPAYLVKHSGVNSGLMITQYVAASLCADNKRLSVPAVTDNFVTSALQEDHLSMGTPSAVKLQDVVNNVYSILAIEWLAAAQACEFFDPSQLGDGTRSAWSLMREHIAPYDEDRWLAPEIEKSVRLLRTQPLLKDHFPYIH